MESLPEPPSGLTSDEFFEFDITDREEFRGPVGFPHDQLAVCFQPRAGTGPLTCTVTLHALLGDGGGAAEATREELLGHLMRASMGDPLLDGSRQLEIRDGQGEYAWVTFRGFGWHDEACTRPVSSCYYTVSLRGHSTIRARVYGISPHYAPG
ncbi:hypothetical protein SSP24_72200 [Streptomyces spinoverrucosus]|uniref:Uncharacterized protein n=1 Tax=Streptomyces spinoverrucosus TaxID=284043 RepID=A0A4Y3VU12_9ACTN|nr:hypothetical protein [Streptomyces spinoverrucosus]GEC09565.1 hypothetical protein SSP24_72200 [Streptomyces spinoverrucosus]GHB95974.1 hypothetical protein GCM10010397_80800 [Streptomyces spinoverrucosus]